MINKDTLKDVLGKDVIVHVGTWNGNDNVISTNIKYEHFYNGSVEYINVYELMNLCKIKASKKGFNITSKVDTKKNNSVARLQLDGKKFKVFVADTEYEAVFNAYEYMRGL